MTYQTYTQFRICAFAFTVASHFRVLILLWATALVAHSLSEEAFGQVQITISGDGSMSEINNPATVSSSTYDEPGGPVSPEWPGRLVPVHEVPYDDLYSSLLMLAHQMVYNAQVNGAEITIPSSTEWNGAIFVEQSTVRVSAKIDAILSRETSINSSAVSSTLGVRGGPEVTFSMWRKSPSGSTSSLGADVYPNPDQGCDPQNEFRGFNDEHLAVDLTGVSHGDMVKFRIGAQFGELYVKSAPEECDGLGPFTQSVFDVAEVERQYFKKTGSTNFTINGYAAGSGNEVVLTNGDQIYFTGASRYFVRRASGSKFVETSFTISLSNNEVAHVIAIDSNDKIGTASIRMRALLYGDPSDDGSVTDHDAQLVLDHTAYLIKLVGTDSTAGEVSGNAEITSYDASLILQYVDGSISCFPVECSSKAGAEFHAHTSGDVRVSPDEADSYAVKLAPDSSNSLVTSLFWKLPFAPGSIAAASTERLRESLPSDWLLAHNLRSSDFVVAMAGVTPINPSDLPAVQLTPSSSFVTAEFGAESVRWTGGTFAKQSDFLKSSEVEEGGVSMWSYPNPFNPRTSVQFNLRENSHVRLRVFDSVGREVAVLVSADLAAGRHEVAFDASTLPSGIYYAYLQTGTGSLTRQLTLSK